MLAFSDGSCPDIASAGPRKQSRHQWMIAELKILPQIINHNENIPFCIECRGNGHLKHATTAPNQFLRQTQTKAREAGLGADCEGVK